MKELKRRVCVCVGGGGGGGQKRVSCASRHCGLKGWQSGKKSVQLSTVAMRSVVCSLIEI